MNIKVTMTREEAVRWLADKLLQELKKELDIGNK